MWDTVGHGLHTVFCNGFYPFVKAGACLRAGIYRADQNSCYNAVTSLSRKVCADDARDVSVIVFVAVTSSKASFCPRGC